MRRRPFVNHVRDCARHAKRRERFTTLVTRCHPCYQWGPGPPVSHAVLFDAVGLPRKEDRRGHDSMTWAREEARDPQPPSGHFSPRNQRRDLPLRMKHKAAKETLSLVLSPPYTSFRLCKNFSSTKFHDTTVQTRSYPNTWGLLGLRFLSQQGCLKYYYHYFFPLSSRES
jgi:hypothetical protein